MGVDAVLGAQGLESGDEDGEGEGEAEVRFGSLASVMSPSAQGD